MENIPSWVPEWGIQALAAAGVLGLLWRTQIAKDLRGSFIDGAKWGASIFMTAKARGQLDAVKASRELSIGLAQILRTSGGNRVSCWVMHNGGGDITVPGTPKFVSVIESADEGVKQDARVYWQAVPLPDAFQEKVISEDGFKDGVLDLPLSSIGPGNAFSDFLRADDITFVAVSRAAALPNGLWFAIVEYKDVDPPGFDSALSLSIARDSARRAARLISGLAPQLR